MNVLLLGGAGFIGLHLARRLVAEDHAVTIVDDFSRGRDDRDLAALRAHPAVNVISADLTDAGRLGRAARTAGTRSTCSPPSSASATWSGTRPGSIRVNTLTALHLLDWVAPGERRSSSPRPARCTPAAWTPASCRCRPPRTCRS